MSDGSGWLQHLDDLHLLTPIRVVAILAVAWAVARVLRATVARVLRRTLAVPGLLSRADATRIDARQRALVAALRSAIVGVVWATASITVVSELGVNIGAFVATATVIGGAVAFGAQQLMRDVIAGFFVLAEDQFGEGDLVDVGFTTGVVERVTLRSMRLNDGVGGVWYVPHGGVGRVNNLSKASAVTIDLEVSRLSPLAEVEAEGRALCDALAADTSIAGRLAGPPTVVGLVDLRDDRLAYRLMVSTEPGAQHAVRSRWRSLVLASFAEGRLRRP